MFKNIKWWLWYRKNVKTPLHVKIINGPGSTLVFLHGIASNIDVWQKVIEPLRGQYQIVLVDLLGFGSSPKPKDIEYNADQHAYAVYYSLHKAKVKKPFSIIGHSMGSIVGLRFAANYSRYISRLTLCSLPVYKRAELSDSKLRFWQAQSDNWYFKAYEMLRGKKGLALKMADILKKLKVREVQLDEQSWVAFERSLQNTIEHQRLEKDILRYGGPVEIIYGKLDPLIITKNIDALEKYRNVSVLRIGDRHDLSDSYSRRVAKAVAKY